MCVDPFAVLLVYVFGIAHSVNYGLFMRKWCAHWEYENGNISIRGSHISSQSVAAGTLIGLDSIRIRIRRQRRPRHLR